MLWASALSGRAADKGGHFQLPVGAEGGREGGRDGEGRGGSEGGRKREEG